MIMIPAMLSIRVAVTIHDITVKMRQLGGEESTGKDVSGL